MPDTVREAQPPSRPARRDEAENAETQQERMGGRERREACAGRGQTTFLIWAAAVVRAVRSPFGTFGEVCYNPSRIWTRSRFFRRRASVGASVASVGLIRLCEADVPEAARRRWRDELRPLLRPLL
eukprot:CAMPEP_0181178284 /NCGR_PEP_ID=MMETSP1096-20121128/5643_1 /TAXON_ID=156174 ORGANISM="Chrysochromulina ericina, Strain CCMP281" /NCGR_SAMPLE_ID=MMETSP1096 /ASSEMBLY_ACC=CAM_ASM_000453 /LENGTH=125 /DNA_ID=CAMNT_0023266553 /DNA_START=248 /DNA_END=623 /DNA_ORIENTATION=+